MSAELLAEHGGASVYHADWRALIDVVRAAGGCNLHVVDAPYSERTHSGHNDKAEDKERGEDYRSRVTRRAISYSSWTPADVAEYVAAWSTLVRGWFLSITDHVLMQAWEAALSAAGRYVFAPIPLVSPGSRVRLSGDGPTQWATWMVIAARPRSREFLEQCRALPGAYVLPTGQADPMPVVGGKQVWHMHRLVEDYSQEGDLVVDPCCGAGTTAIGAVRSGRRAIVGDVDRAHADLAAQWIRDPWRKAPASTEREASGTLSLFAAEGW